MKLLKNNKIGTLAIVIALGIFTVGCSEDVKAIDPSNLKSTKVETTKEDKKDEKQVAKKTEESGITKEKAEAIINKMFGSNDWEVIDSVTTSEKREFHVLQRKDVSSDYRFLVDKKTGEKFCEVCTNVGVYFPVNNMDDVDMYLESIAKHPGKPYVKGKDSTYSYLDKDAPLDSNETQKSATENNYDNSEEDSYTEESNTSSVSMTSEEAKDMVINIYGDVQIEEPIKTTYHGEEVWKVQFKMESDGEFYDSLVHINCHTGEMYTE